MKTYSLKAEERKVTGRKVKTLRALDILPANVYGKGVKSVSVQVALADFDKVFKEAGETGIVELDLGKEKKPVLVNNIQKNPVTEKVLHVDFFQVNLKEKVTAQIPVELTGEAPSEKLGVGTAVQYVNEIEVEALPADLIEQFSVDISNLSEVDQAIHIKDLDYDRSKIEVKDDLEAIVVKVEPPQKEEEVAPPAEEVPEGEGEEVSETPEGEVAQEKKEIAPEEKKE